MSAPLQDKAAIVTGAARGIGRATAIRLARDGAHVVVTDLDEAGVGEVAAAIRAMGRRSVALGADVTRREDRERIVAATLAEFGRIDILVNNAGIFRMAPLLETTEEDWDATMNVNARAVFFLTQAVARQMVQQGGGRIINVASAAAKLSNNPYGGPYNCSKAAVVALTKTFGLNLAKHGVRVNAVCPGIVETDMWKKLDEFIARQEGLPVGEPIRRRLESIPVGRLETPDDVAGVIAFLAGPDSDYMTGQAINVTGGLVHW
ncbi:MAG TPA: SDR family NAD(P)-dependent oxidoreductase [Chloroflexota bacterium]